jgi:hypothetical protein
MVQPKKFAAGCLGWFLFTQRPCVPITVPIPPSIRSERGGFPGGCPPRPLEWVFGIPINGSLKGR